MLIILLSLFLPACSTLTLATQTVSPLTASSPNSSYLYTFSSSGQAISANSQFVAQFDTGAFVITQVSTCQLAINNVNYTGINCTANSGANTITIGNISTTALTATSLIVGFFTSGAVYSGSLSVLMYFMDSSGLQIDSRVNTTLTIIPASMTTCSVSNLNQIVGSSTAFTFGFTPVVSISASSVLQIVLPAWFGNSSNLVNNASANCSQNCSATLSTSSQSILFRTMFTSATSSAQSVDIYSIRNPPTSQPISISIIIQTLTNQNVQRCFVNLSATTANNLRATFNTSNSSISAVNSIRLSFRNTNPIQVSNTYLRISSPLTINYTYSSANSTSSTAPTRVSSTDGSVLITSLSSSNIMANFVYNLGLFSMSNPTSTKKITLTFTTESLVSSVYYVIDSTSLDITAVASTITVFSISAQTNTAYSIGSFTVSFTTVNALITDSYAIIQVPSEMSIITTSNCTTLFGTCTFNGNTVTVNIDMNTSAGTNVSLTLSHMQNPLRTVATSTFSISTYYNGSDSLVDQLTSGLTFTALPNPIKSTTVTPGSFTVGAVTTYTFKTNFTNPVPAGSIISITFPSSIPISTITFPSTNTLPCIASLISQVVTLTGCVTTQTSSELTFILGGITNPLSTKPTTTFNITSTSTNLLEYMSSNLTVTMVTPMNFNSVAVSAGNSTVNALNGYTVIVGFGTTQSVGNKIVLTIPTELTIVGPQCTAQSGITTISCSLSINILTVTLVSTPSSQITFLISNLTNNWYTSTSTITFLTQTNDTNTFYIESGSASLSFLSGFMSSSTASDNGIALMSTSAIKLTIQQPFSLSKATSSLLYVTVQLPSNSFRAGSTGCASTSGTCVYSSSLNGYNVTGIATNAFPILLQFSALTDNFQSTSSPFIIQLYYNGSLITSNTNTTVAVYCTNPCKQCTTSRTNCSSCLSTLNTSNITLYRPNNTCVNTCPDGYFTSSSTSTCEVCNANCSLCSNSSANCSKCASGTNTYLYNSACTDTCPTNYYKNGSLLICMICNAGCATCLNSTYCWSCSTGYLLSLGSCVSTCTNDSFVPINGTCTPCVSSCLTCSVTTSNCTSCLSTLFFYNQSCLSSCPSQTYKSGLYCYNCVSPCVECTSSIICSSCNTTQSLYGTTCLTKCPDGYLSIASKCQACTSNCLTCSNLLSNCTDCLGSFYLYNNNTCVAVCPDPTHPFGKICTKCITPCDTCTGTASNCTTCLNNMTLLNGTCYSSCPSGYYEANKQCFSCGNCLACITPTNCTACFTGTFLLNGLCYSSCPPSTPILQGQQCVACSSDCFTCSSIPNNCTSCPTTSYLFRYACLSTCPIGMYTNRVNNTCQDSLVNRNIFFPLLIISIVLACIVFVSKCYALNTSINTALVAIIALPEFAVFIYYMVVLAQDTEGINMTVPLVLGGLAIVIMLVLSAVFYFLNKKKVKEDQYLAGWLESKCNYYTYLIFMHLALLNLKLYRFVYCRLFNIHALSLYLKDPKSIFPLTTLFTLLIIFLSQIVMIASTILTLYLKTAKDQTFYTAIQCLILASLSIIFSLVDIHKEDSFFGQSEYLVVKKYLDQTRDTKKAQSDEIPIFDAPSVAVDSENCFGTGYQTFYKNSGSVLMDQSGQKGDGQKELIDDRIEDDDEIYNIELETQGGGERRDGSAVGSNRRKKRINIFEPIREEQAEEFEEQPYSNNYMGNTRQVFSRIVQANLRRQKSDCGQKLPHAFDIVLHPEDDTKSLAEPKQLRKKWNTIITDRHEEARRIYNRDTIEKPVAQQLYKGTIDSNDMVVPVRKRRKMKVTKSMKKTQEIYLQRLVVLEDRERTGAQTTTTKKKRKKKSKEPHEEYYFPDDI